MSGPLQQPRNALLHALHDETLARLQPHLEATRLEAGDVVYEAGDRVRHVYFPIDALLSLQYVMLDGASAEIAMVGRDGAAGVGVLMGADISHHGVVVQVGGRAWRLPSEDLCREFSRNGQLHERLLEYTQALLTQMAQTAVCSRHHALERQFCRWLLFALDRVPAASLHMTQERIANALGVRRESVSAAARKLQDLGVICYGRGRIELLDRQRLEALSCECYGVVRRETERIRRNPDTKPVPA